MSRVASTYWVNSQQSPKRATVSRSKGRAAIDDAKQNRTSTWVAALVLLSISFMLALTVNYRSFANLRDEATANQELETQIQNKTQENLGLQEEIHYLKTDAAAVEREAKKFGYLRPAAEKEKVLTPAK